MRKPLSLQILIFKIRLHLARIPLLKYRNFFVSLLNFLLFMNRFIKDLIIIFCLSHIPKGEITIKAEGNRLKTWNISCTERVKNLHFFCQCDVLDILYVRVFLKFLGFFLAYRRNLVKDNFFWKDIFHVQTVASSQRSASRSSME